MVNDKRLQNSEWICVVIGLVESGVWEKEKQN